MAKFIESFEMGLSAAKVAEHNRQEIDSVFEELNAQLAVATKGKVAIRRMQLNEPGLNFTVTIDTWSRAKYWALCAVFLPNDGLMFTEIAKWEQDSSGFPCRVKIGVHSYSCEDKTGLEGVLEMLLADASVGEVLYGYITMSASDAGTQ